MWNVEDLYRLLRAGHLQAQGMVDTVPDPLLVLDESLCVQNASRSFFETFKVDRYETLGQPFAALGNGQWNIPALIRLLKEVVPKSAALINYEVKHDFPDLGPRTMLLTARTLYHPDNGSRAMLLSIVDASDQRRRDDARDMLFGELRHRMKNILAVAQSLARNTATSGRSAAEFRDDFLGRFRALLEAQDVGFSEEDGLGLKALIERVLAPFAANPNSIAIEPGPPVPLSPRELMSLGLVLHELATNAAKFGALSVAGGKVTVSWQWEAESRRLRLKWSESGGPSASPPAETGYGTRLIKSAITYSLGGEVDLTYAATGLQVEIVVPIGPTPAPG